MTQTAMINKAQTYHVARAEILIKAHFPWQLIIERGNATLAKMLANCFDFGELY